MIPNPQTSYLIRLQAKKDMTLDKWLDVMRNIAMDYRLDAFTTAYNAPHKDTSAPIHVINLVLEDESIPRDNDIKHALIQLSTLHPEITVYAEQHCEEPWEPDEEYTIQEGYVLESHHSSIVNVGQVANEPSRKAIEWYLRRKGLKDAADAVHSMPLDRKASIWCEYKD